MNVDYLVKNQTLAEKFGIKSKLSQKIFNHKNIISLTPLKRQEINGVRHYYIDEDNLWVPSVTSILDKMLDKQHISEWIKKVGVEEAEIVKKRASVRGTNIHGYLEEYCLNSLPVINVPSNMLLFNQIKKVLDNHVDNIRCVEGSLFSKKLKIAGTCDLIAEYDGELAIIDYKTARNIKYESDIKGYFLQTTLYSYMIWEMLGLKCKNIIVIISNDDTLEAQVYIKKAKNYIEEATNLVRAYYENLHVLRIRS